MRQVGHLYLGPAALHTMHVVFAAVLITGTPPAALTECARGRHPSLADDRDGAPREQIVGFLSKAVKV